MVYFKIFINMVKERSMVTFIYRIYLHNFLCSCRYFAVECEEFCRASALWEGAGGRGHGRALVARAVSLLPEVVSLGNGSSTQNC